MESPRDIFVDVSATASLNRLTGIQRVVSEIADSSARVKLLRHSPKFDGYILVTNKLSYVEKKSHLNSSWNWIFLVILETFWKALTALFPIDTKFGNLIFRGAIWLYNSALSNLRIAPEKTATEGDLVPVPDDVWLLDVPKTAEHITFLEGLVSKGTVRLHVYLYDLIPLEPDLNLLANEAESKEGIFQRYLLLVTKASSVFCLSEFTKSRYLDFRNRQALEARQKIRVVYPPLHHYLTRISADRDDNSSVFPGNSGFGRAPFTVMAVAPRIPRKNLLVLVEAMHSLLEKKLPFALIVVSPFLADSEARVTRKLFWLALRYPRQVRVVSQIPDSDFSRFLSAADCVAVPSRLEGYGIPLVEAAYGEKQIIAGPAPVFRELADYIHMVIVEDESSLSWEEELLRARKRMSGFRGRKRPVITPEDFVKLMVEAQRELQRGSSGEKQNSKKIRPPFGNS